MNYLYLTQIWEVSSKHSSEMKSILKYEQANVSVRFVSRGRSTPVKLSRVDRDVGRPNVLSATLQYLK